MEWLHQLLRVQNQSWFYDHKEYFRQKWKVSGVDRYAVLQEWFLEFPALREKIQSPISESCGHEFHWILYGADDYPTCFYAMMDAPLILTVIGHKPWMQNPCLSVVGSRKPTVDSLKWIDQELGIFVAQEKPVIVSGGAFGVDQAAHALALRKKNPTMAVLPSGLGAIYPEVFKDWTNAIVETGGSLISEYPLQQRMAKGFFHHRNRLIAHIGVATLVVQAALKSGTLMTGHLAAEAGRPLWVLPGHPLQSAYLGNLKLLQEGATLVTSAEDLSIFFQVEIGPLNTHRAYIVENKTFLN